MIPRATQRLQFHRGFTFQDATALVPYFARLGISHVYASPITAARPGSQHGYDVIDPTKVNPELGGEEALRVFVEALRLAGLGLIVDIVPNHMAADTRNGWWRDVLRHGRESRYARYFDIDWQVEDSERRGKVLLPVLGRPLAEAIEAGELEIVCDAEGAPAVRYFSSLYPLAADSGGHDESLATVLARQHYRLASWRTAGDRINWRRFFDINELVCLRMEEPAAFDEVHALPLRLYAEGLIDGLRVDHVDGLTDPASYCRRLRRRLDEAAAGRGRPRAYLVVEKILLKGEMLSPAWQCDGTTGYDFMNDVSALQHDARGEAPLAASWAAISGRPAAFAGEEQAARREIIARSFSAQLDACVALFLRVAQARPDSSELSVALLRRVLAEFLVHFPVYRTYGAEGMLSPDDRAVLRAAADGARSTALATDRWAVDLALRCFTEPADDPGLAALQQRAVARFQQLSAPVAAKSVEDTAFYRYGRLLSRNDVGFDVECFAEDAQAFYALVAARQAGHAHAMLATATHDHKRGEDVRARLAVLSELSTPWSELMTRWIERSAPLRRGVGDRPAPSAGDIAFLLQTTVGAWPFDLERGDRDGRAAFAERLAAWQQKALREAKLRSDWAAVDEAYEEAARQFTMSLIAEGASGLLDEIAALVRRIAPAGAVNGLAQCLLKLTVPGVPDLYQGTEFWDLSLVDPDNRRPVDFAARIAGLDGAGIPALAATWRDGRIKQALIARVLALRRRAPSLFGEGDYLPVEVEGERAASVVAFIRRRGEDRLLVVAPRLPLRLLPDGDTITIAPEAWKDTALRLDSLSGCRLYDALGGAAVGIAAGWTPIAQLCTALPLAVLSTVAPAAPTPPVEKAR